MADLGHGRRARARRLRDLVPRACAAADPRRTEVPDLNPHFRHPAQALKALRDSAPVRFKKSLSQHFLIEPRPLDGIAAALQLNPGDRVLEIGPGAGFLTERLLATGAAVTAVEVDPHMAELLDRNLGAPPRLTLLAADILKANLPDLLGGDGPPWAVAGNLPYHVTTPVLFAMQEHRRRISRMVFTVQKEVADRMIAKPGTDDYSALSVALAHAGKTELLFRIGAGAFHPRPRVDSAVVRLTPAGGTYSPGYERALRDVVRAAFGQRRKTLLNALTAIAGGREQAAAAIAAAGLDGNARGETLTLAEFRKLAEQLIRA